MSKPDCLSVHPIPVFPNSTSQKTKLMKTNNIPLAEKTLEKLPILLLGLSPRQLAYLFIQYSSTTGFVTMIGLRWQ
jgi:hypothetical protein